MTGLNIIEAYSRRIIHTVILVPDQVEGDVKDTVYQIAGISSILSSPTPDQVGGDFRDTVYQTTGIAFKVSNAIPARRPE